VAVHSLKKIDDYETTYNAKYKRQELNRIL